MRSRPSLRGFTLIELMIIIALLGVWVVNIPELLPWSWKASARIARDHAQVETVQRLQAHLAADLERGTPSISPGHNLVITDATGREVVYILDLCRDRVVRVEGDHRLQFDGLWLRLMRPLVPGRAWQ